MCMHMGWESPKYSVTERQCFFPVNGILVTSHFQDFDGIGGLGFLFSIVLKIKLETEKVLRIAFFNFR